MTFGRVNPQFQLEDQGITGLGNVYYNLIEMVKGSRVDGHLLYLHEGKQEAVKAEPGDEATPDNETAIKPVAAVQTKTA